MSDIFGDKYRVERQLASKGGRKTLLAKDTKSDTLVVIKLLTFNDNFRWEDLKLFEREAETLKSLSHDAIPQYLDYFEVDTSEIKGFALVQSYIEAPSLAQQIAAGRTFSEAEVKQIASQILVILNYLHSRQPPVIHRDIKPSNILLGDRSGNSVGQIYLIDFGSVQNVATKNTSTLTVVGTYGYMPPEQFGGRAKPASDIYSLGATIIYLVTGEHPADLPETDLKIEFEEHCNLSSGFTYWLKQITNPSLGSRLAPAIKALEALENCDLNNEEQTKFTPPPKSKILIDRSTHSYKISIPSIRLLSFETFLCFVISLFFLTPWSLAVEDMLNGASISVIFLKDYHFLFYILYTSIAFFVNFPLWQGLFAKQILEITEDRVSLYRTLGKFRYNTLFEGICSDIQNIEKVALNSKIFFSNNYFITGYLYLVSNHHKITIVDNISYLLKYHELDWLAKTISTIFDCSLVEKNINEYQSNKEYIYNTKAYNYYSEENYLKALEYYNLAIKINPNSSLNYTNRSLINVYLGNYQAAVEDCYLALEIDSENPTIYCARGSAYYYLKDYRSAIKDLQKAIDINAKEKEAYYYLANTYMALNENQKAIEQCNKIIKIYSNYEHIYLVRAYAYIELNNYQKTINDCDRAIKINYRLAEVYTLRGRAYFYSSNLKQALFNFHKQIKVNPCSYSYYYLGCIEYSLNQNSQAIISLSQCIEINSQDKFAYYARANIYYEQKDRDKALEDYQTATTLENTISDTDHNKDEHAYYARGLAKYRLGNDIESAIHNLEKAKKIATQYQYTELIEKAVALIEELESM